MTRITMVFFYYQFVFDLVIQFNTTTMYTRKVYSVLNISNVDYLTFACTSLDYCLTPLSGCSVLLIWAVLVQNDV